MIKDLWSGPWAHTGEDDRAGRGFEHWLRTQTWVSVLVTVAPSGPHLLDPDSQCGGKKTTAVD